MTAQQLITSVETKETLDDFDSLPTLIRCLWLAGKGKWELAHDIVESIPNPAGAWIHAHLHRQEGDLSNASYWYYIAGVNEASLGLGIKDEWLHLVHALVKDPS